MGGAGGGSSMNWQQLISSKRFGQENRHIERHDDRSEFKRDYDRLIFSAPFRRLQNKTQVFPLPGSIFVHNRLTHSLEVASVGMSLGNDVAKDIINGIEGQTQSVTQEDDMADATIAIVTDKEYCLIYHPEDDASLVYVQISNRKYNYASDNSPYKSSSSTTRWYRSHYYSSSYSSDSSTYKSTPSAYSSYGGDTIHDIGNGYYDSYSSSVRQSSINSRKSSSGGGK